jgi:hypothetical protein
MVRHTVTKKVVGVVFCAFSCAASMIFFSEIVTYVRSYPMSSTFSSASALKSSRLPDDAVE